MKNDVLEFLASDNEKPQEKFNKALRLYRSSKNSDESQVRFMNRLGYSPARLEDLLYQLKTLHGITDVELATARNKGKKKAEKKNEGTIAQLAIHNIEEAFDAEISELDLEALVKIDSIVSEEIKKITASAMPEDLFYKVKGFYEILNHRHFDKEIKTLRENMVGMNDEDLFDELKRLPEERIPADLASIFNNLRNQANAGVNDDKVKQLEVNAAEEVNGEKAPQPPKGEQNNAPEKSSEEKNEGENATDGDSDPDELKKAAEAEKAEFLKNDLGGFDVESESYNSAKSFAAVLSDYIKEDPKDQKWATLKAFISDAKKKHSKA